MHIRLHLSELTVVMAGGLSLFKLRHPETALYTSTVHCATCCVTARAPQVADRRPSSPPVSDTLQASLLAVPSRVICASCTQPNIGMRTRPKVGASARRQCQRLGGHVTVVALQPCLRAAPWLPSHICQHAAFNTEDCIAEHSCLKPLGCFAFICLWTCPGADCQSGRMPAADSDKHDQAGSNEVCSMGQQGLDKPQPTLHPIAHLLHALRCLKRMYLEPAEATARLSHLVERVLAAHPRLIMELVRFGWSHQDYPGASFWAQTLDVQGLAGCLKKFKYEKLQQLGSGSYGVVFKARDVESGEVLAIKKLTSKWDQDDDCGLPDSTIREITTLRELNHPHIVRLRDIISTVGSSHVYLVLDFLDCDLRHYLNTCPEASSPAVIKSVIYQILSGVAHLHSCSVLHRDLKPQNVLVERSTGRIKITDFGLARSYLPPHKPYTEKVVTLYYRAPELLLGCPVYSRSIDLWSVGCIMAEMLCFKPLFLDNTEVGLIMKVFQTLGTPTELQWPGITELLRNDFGGELPFWPQRSLDEVIPYLAQDADALDLLSSLLVYDPAARISAAAALKHPWFWDVKVPAPPAPCDFGLPSCNQHTALHNATVMAQIY